LQGDRAIKAQRTKRLAAALVACILCIGPSLSRAESVDVKYRGEVDLKSFDCTDITRSSFIKRVCYDKANEYMLIDLNGTFYDYCEIDAGTVSSLLNAPSMGRFYLASIKGNFDCREHRVPEGNALDPVPPTQPKWDDLSPAPPVSLFEAAIGQLLKFFTR